MNYGTALAVKISSIWCCLLIGLGSLGLVMPYLILRDPAWIHRVETMVGVAEFGFAIEWGRLLLFVACLYFGIALGFRETAAALLGLSAHGQSGNGRVRLLCQIAIVSIGVGMAIAFVGPCFDRSADGLSAKLVANRESDAAYESLGASEAIPLASIDQRLASARRSFAWYGLYSVVFWASVVPIVVAVPLYAFFREDWKRMVAIRRQVAAASHADTPDAAKARFRRFRLRLTKLSTRYVRVMVAISLAVAYELYLGSLIMSREAREGISVGLVLVGANALLIVAILYIYYDGWQNVRHRLIELGQDEGALGESESPTAYLRFLLRFDHGAIVATLLALTPLREQFGHLFDFLQK